MTEIAIRPTTSAGALDLPSTQDKAIERLAEWAQAAAAAHQIAQQLVATSFAPAQYRGKPAEATAAILAGTEVGLSPMAALRAFDNISGTPAPKAITLRAIVQAHGHDVRIDESTDKVATVSVRRKGSTEWQTCTWTIERAQQAGFVAKNPNWKSNPAAMLVARATAEGCRWVASDAIMGMPYSSEEIRDGAGEYDTRPAPVRVTAAEILGQSDAPQQIEPAPAPQPQPEQEPPAEQMTTTQRGRMFALFAEKGITRPDAQRQFVSGVLGRPVESRGALSPADATLVIKSLEARSAPAEADDQGVDPDNDQDWPNVAQPAGGAQ